MSATVMFTMVRTDGRYGKTRRNLVTLPLVAALLDEPGSTAGGLKYLPLEDAPAPAPQPSPTGRSTFPGYSQPRDVARSGGLSFCFGEED